jgi:virginiamycin B lyase
MLASKENAMRRLLPPGLGLALLFVTAACAGHQAGGGLIPASLASHRLGPDAGSSIVEFKFTSTGLNFITPDFHGNEWFGAAHPLAMVSIDEHTGKFTEYDLPGYYTGPYGLALNSAHNVLWFTMPDSNAIGYINLLNDTIGEFVIPTSNSRPKGVTYGPDGGVWFAESRSGKIGRIDATTHAFSEYKLSPPSKPFGITTGPDGALWFTNLRSIGRITTNGKIHLYPIGQNDPTGITAAPDGGVWFTGKSDQNGSLLGRIDPKTHVRKIYKYSSGDGGNEGITVRNSDFWMTRQHANRIDRFDHSTHIIHSRLLPNGYTRPYGIALGEDDQLWFVNDRVDSGAIGKLCPDLPAAQCKGAL